jgi:2-dehydropantoate 2-reductase
LIEASSHARQRVLVVGAGAIGCTLAWHLAGSSAEVTLLARGAARESIDARGLTLRQGGSAVGTRRILTLDSGSMHPGWDAILVCVKQYDIAQALRDIAPYLQPHTLLVPVVNGVPWWLLLTHPKLMPQPLSHWGPSYADIPDLPLRNVVAGVIQIPAHMHNAHTVEQGPRNTLAIGEIEGPLSDRVQRLAALFNACGLHCHASPAIQTELWTKLMGNSVFNPISALANASMHQMLREPALRGLCAQVMSEVLAVGQALGCAPAISVAQRLDQAQSAGDARTSMLQDATRNRRIEGDTLVGVVAAIARQLDLHTPALNGVWALLSSRFMRA